MSSTQAESVIRNIIREIAQTCLSRGQTLSETLIAFMVSDRITQIKLMNVFTLVTLVHYLCVQVKAVVLDPRNHFNVDRTLTKQDVQKLIEVNRKLF